MACVECRGTGRAAPERGCCSNDDGRSSHGHGHGSHDDSAPAGSLLETMDVLDLENERGEPVRAKDAFRNKVVGLYFTAKHCPACVRFGPELAHFGEAERNGYVTVVVSGDADPQSADASFHSMCAYARNRTGNDKVTTLRVPFHSKHRPYLLTKFSVFAIPALHVWHPVAKKALTAWGHTAVSFNEKKCVAQWHAGQAGWEIGVLDWLNPLPQCVSLAGFGKPTGSNAIEYRGVASDESERDLATKTTPPQNQSCDDEACHVK